MYAVIQDGGRQFCVHEGDRIQLDHRDAEAGQQIELDRVLACRGPEGALLGTPTVAGATVVAEVVEQSKGPKIHVQKFRRRKGYRRRTGCRQTFTEVEIREIRLPE